MTNKLCEVEGCQNGAVFNLYRILSDGTKVWLKVCPLHEKEIGDENEKRKKGVRV